MRLSCASAYPQLPSELWIRVFFWVTYSPVRDVENLVAVPLFDGIAHREYEARIDDALRMKNVLSLVCRQWRALSKQYLYEDLRIRHGKDVLAEVLESSRKECPQAIGKGRYVNRIALPLNQERSSGHGHSRHWADEPTSRIIKCCPNLMVLTRYYKIFEKDGDRDSQPELADSSYHSVEEGRCCSIHDPSLPSLLRLDWTNGPMMNDPWHPTICAIPSSLWSAHQLQILSLSGENYFWGPMELQSLSAGGQETIFLPQLHTLRVGSVYAFGVPGVSNYILALPSLRRIILERGEALHRLIECVSAFPRSSPYYHPTIKPRVTALEIGSAHWRFSRSDYISTLIRHYPDAESLHYPVFFARPMRWRRIRDNGLRYSHNEAHRTFPNLHTIGWHAEPNPELTYSDESENADLLWSHLYAHARAVLGSTAPTLLESRLPGVRTIMLYGTAWISFLTDVRFHLVLDLARRRGAEIRAEDPRVVDALTDALFNYASDLVQGWVCML